MYKIMPNYYPMMEIILQAVEDGNPRRSHAAMAWWLGQQKINNEDDYWLKVAGKITAELASVDKTAILDQLTSVEAKFVTEPVDAYPEIPAQLAIVIASWDPIAAEPDIERLRLDAVAKVDRAAETYRLHFITAGSGQTMAYQQKLEEARKVLADDSVADADVPHIVAEAAVDGVSRTEKATEIVATFSAWQTVSAGIEAKRMTAKRDIAIAETADAIALAANVSWGA